MSTIQERIQSLLDAAVADGRERGAQVAVYHRGELVADAWAGVADTATGRAVDGETLFPVFSVTKGLLATIVHRLVERGALDYDTRIADLWPEFAANGKEGVTVRQALNHTAGIPQMPQDVVPADLADWGTMCEAVARLRPLWPPGTRVFYHAVTFGWIVGEVARRAAGRTVPELIRQELCGPIGVADLYSCLPPEADARVAVLEEPGVKPMEPPADMPPTISPWMWPLHEWMNRTDARRACIPASNGIMSARALARHYAALVPGGVDGVELLPPRRVRLANEPQRGSGDPPEGEARGLGYHPIGLGGPPGAPATGFGHGGYGGAIGLADPGRRLAVAFTRNLYAGQDTLGRVLDEVRAATEG